MTIDDINASVDHLSEKNNFTKDPFKRLAFLAEELGELSRALTALEYAKETGVGIDQARVELGREISDVIWNAAAIAKIEGIDLAAAIDSKLSFNNDREFPKRI